jgi:hypothetical protein
VGGTSVSSSLDGNLLEVEKAGFTAFGHRFSGRVANWRQDLIDLEREGVTYGDFVFDEEKGGPGLYRVDFTRTELYGYVRGVLGWDQFLAGGFDAVQDRSLAREAEKSAADRHEYDSGAERVCAADFLGEEVENLVCGGRLDRVQRVRAADPGLEAIAMVQHVAAALPTATKALTNRRKGKADFEIADEHDLQDLLYFALRSVFEDVRREEWTPSAAGGAKRVDLVIPDVRVMVEVKVFGMLAMVAPSATS